MREWVSATRRPSTTKRPSSAHSPPSRVEAHVDVVAGERGPEGERVVGEAGVAPEPRGEGRDVEGRGALLLELVAVDEGVVLDHDLGHRVRERGARRRRRRRSPRAGTRSPAPPRRGCGRRRPPGSPSPAERCATWIGSFRTVPGATSTTAPSSAKAVLRSAKTPVRPSATRPSQRLQAPGLRAQHLAQARHLDAGLPGVERRQLGREPAVHEDDARPRGGPRGAARRARPRTLGAAGSAGTKRPFASGATGVWRHASSRAVGRPDLDEARDGGGAPLAQPRGVGRAWAAAKRSKPAR